VDPAALTAPGTLFEITEEDVRGHRMQVFKQRYTHVAEMLDATARYADRPFVADRGTRLTFAQHLAAVDALAAGLSERYRIRPGDRVGLFAANRWEWIVAFWAVVRLGAIPAAFNGWWSAEEVAHASALVQPVVVVGDEPRLERLAGVRGEFAPLDLGEVPELVERHQGDEPPPGRPAEDDTAILLFTSGTTGRAKAVMVTHRSVIGFVQLNACRETLASIAMGGPVPSADDGLAPSDEVILITSPLFHTSMLQGMVMAAVYRGSSVVLLPGRFEPERVLRTIQEERVTLWSALGSAATRVCASDGVGRYDTGSLRRLAVGGAPVSPAVQSALRRAFPSAAGSLGMGYTSTEAGAVVAGIGGPEYLDHPTSTGRVTVTTALEIRDPDGRLVPDGAEGEIHVRSPYTMLGYWNDPDASAAVLKGGGWLGMGDVGRMEEGRLYINSRARDLILVSAENVSPTEVEYCLEEHPAVIEAAVFAVDDPITGDTVCAVVSRRPHDQVGEDDLAAWCAGRLAHFKVPTRWYVVDEPLARTASGKLLKAELRRQVEGAR
jgi:acyl-CoA synthetase (AMP-forming)/AMP-acid ligase II